MREMEVKYEKKHRRLRLNGIFYAALSSASFGFSPLFSIWLLEAGLSNSDILSYRWTIAGIVLMIYAACKKKSLRPCSYEEVWKITLLSALRALTSVTLLIGYANIATGVASTINFMYPVVVAMCMMMFFGEQKSLINIAAIVLSIFGVYLLASGDGVIIDGGNTQLGFICSIISALSFAAYYILMKKLKADKIEVVKFTTWIMMLSGLYFIIVAFFVEGKLTLVKDFSSWLYIAGLGLWATMVSNFTAVKAVRRIGPTLTSIFGALQPLTAVILGACFLNEHLGFKTIIGIVLIMIAVVMVVTYQKKRKAA